MWELDFSGIDVQTSCYDCMINLLLKLFGYEHQFWELRKFSNKHFVVSDYSKRIIRGINDSEFLDKFFSIKSIYLYKEHNNVNTQEIIQKELEYSPIGVFADTYDCFWSSLYKKQHIQHFFLIIGFIETENKYICVDIYYSTTGIIELSFDELNRLYSKINLFVYKENRVSLESAFDYIKATVKIPDKNLMEIEKTNMYAYLSSISIEEIGTEDTLNASLLLLKLKFIAEDKLGFMAGLQYFDTQLNNPIFESAYNPLELASKEIMLLKNTLIKYVFTKSLDKKNIQNHVSNFYNANYDLCEKLKEIIQKEEKNIAYRIKKDE